MFFPVKYNTIFSKLQAVLSCKTYFLQLRNGNSPNLNDDFIENSQKQLKFQSAEGYFTTPAPEMGALTRISSGIPAGR